jgi:outer membrane protein assembly complex protein YaeT
LAVRFRTGRLRWLVWVAGALLLFLLIVVAALHTPAAQHYVLERVQAYLRTSHQLELAASSLRYNLLDLSAELRDVSLRAVGAPDLPPLLKARVASVDIALRDLCRGLLVVESARLEGLDLTIVFDEQGRGNLPAAGAEPGEPLEPEAFAFVRIGSLEIPGGSFLYEDPSAKLRAALPSWSLRINGKREVFSHVLSLTTEAPGALVFQGRPIPIDLLRLRAEATAQTVEVNDATVHSGASRLTASGKAEDLSAPRISLSADGDIDLAEISGWVGVAEPLGGRLLVKASASGPAGEPQIRARIEGSELAFRDFRQVSLAAEAAWRAPGGAVAVESLNVRSPLGHLGGTAQLALFEEGGLSSVKAAIHRLDLERLSRILKLPVVAAAGLRGTVEARWQGMNLPGATAAARLQLSPARPAASPNVLPVAGTLRAAGRLDGRVTIEIARLEALGSEWQGSLVLDALERLDGDLRVTVPRLDEFASSLDDFLGGERTLSDIGLGGSLALSAQLGGTLAAPEAALEVETSGLRAGRFDELELSVAASGSPQRVVLDRLSLGWQNQRLLASGTIDLAAPSPVLHLDAGLTDAPLSLVAALLGEELPVEGALNLTLAVRGTADEPAARASLEIPSWTAFQEDMGKLALEAELAGKRVELTRLDIEKPSPEGEPGALRLHGHYDLEARAYAFAGEARGLVFHGLTLPDGLAPRGTLDFTAEGKGTPETPQASLDLKLSGLRIEEYALGDLESQARLEGVQGRIELRAPQYNVMAKANGEIQGSFPAQFEVATESLELSRLGIMLDGEPIAGRLTARVQGAGELADWQRIEAVARVEDLLVELRGQRIANEGPLEFGFRDGVVRAGPATLVAGGSRISLAGALPLEGEGVDSLKIHGTFDLPSLAGMLPGTEDFTVTGSARLAAELRGSFKRLHPSFEFEIPEATAASRAMEGMSGALSLTLSGDMPRLEDPDSLRLEATIARLDLLAQNYRLRLEEPARISAAKGVARVDNFVLTGPETRLEVTGTAGLAEPLPLALRLAGGLNASLVSLFTREATLAGPTRFEVAVGGTAEAPELTGFLTVERGVAAISQAGIRADELDLRLVFRERQFELEHLTGFVNGGDLLATGSFRLDPSGLSAVELHAAVRDVFLNLPPGMRTRTDVLLEVRSRDELIVAGGEVNILEGSYRELLELESELFRYVQASSGVEFAAERSPLLQRLLFDVAIATESPLVISNNLMEGTVAANLKLVGTYYRPALTGRLVIEEGAQIYLSERRYFVERGVISFVNETRIEPALDILARTRVSGYDIELNLAGGPGDLSATFTSDPPLSQPDIVSVLVTGRTLDQMQGAELNVAREQVLSYVFGRAAGRLSRQAQQTLGLSQVRIEPALISPESNPGARLTVGQDLTDFLRLIHSMNLADSRDQIQVLEYNLTRRFLTRSTRQADNTYRLEFNHDLRFGGRREDVTGSASLRRDLAVRSVDYRGNLGFDKDRIASRFGLWPEENYNFFKAQRGIDRLHSFYWNRDRLEATVRVHRQVTETAVDLVVNIEAGPEVKFRHEGVDLPRALRRRIRNIWIDGVTDAQRLQDAEQAIRRDFAGRGFLQVLVRSEIAAADPDSKEVVFRVERGPRFRNVGLVFEGASAIEPARLRRLIENEDMLADVYTDPEPVKRLLARYYREEGYLAAAIGNPRRELEPEVHTGQVVLPIVEGPLFQVRELRFEGNRAFDAERLESAVPLRPGEPFRPALLEEALENLEELYWSNGYTGMEAAYTLGGERDRGLADITFRIAENRKSMVERVEVEGTHETSERFVRNQLELQPGDVVDYHKTNQSRRNLYHTGAYSLVELETKPLPAAPAAPANVVSPTLLHVRLREVRPYNVRYGAFFDTERGPGFIADLVTRNKLGSARVLGIRTRYDGEFRELRTYFSQPSLRTLPLSTNLIGYASREIRETFLTDRIGFSLQQEARPWAHTLLSYGYRFERTDTYDKDPDSLFRIPPFHVAPLAFSWTRETRDDILDATHGSLLSQALEFAPSQLGSDVKFIKYLGQYFKYVGLTEPAEVPFGGGLIRPRLVYAGGVRFGLGKGLGGQDLIQTERFFAGGGTTLRGFARDSVGPVDFFGPTGGDALLVVNNELRFPLYRFIDGVGFLDLGNVYRRIGDFKPWELRKSAGPGLRVRTPYFLLRLDLGFVLDPRDGERRTGLFFAIGQAF